MIKLLVNGQEVKFTTTIFPDGTSQVWKVEDQGLNLEEAEILWVYENESELFHVLQLAHLLEAQYGQTTHTP